MHNGIPALTRILHSKIQNGDIVVMISHDLEDYAYLFRDNPLFSGTDILPMFDRPHSCAEEVWIDKSHTNHRGYRLIGEYFHNILKQNQGRFAEILSRLTLETEECRRMPKNAEEITVDAGLQEYLNFLADKRTSSNDIGAIVMNANPFTNGHRYLVEYAVKHCSFLYIFVLQEEKSFFKFGTRFSLVEKGVEDLSNVCVLPGGKFIISTETLPEYFNKEDCPFVTIDASKDLQTFCEHIAPTLNISKRFVGEEPLDNITRQYNEQMKECFCEHSLEVVEIPRKTDSNGDVISASVVRSIFVTKQSLEEIQPLVPESTFEFLMIANKS
jgi:[citrate (pro-3S)-lyase] ligase